MGGKGSMVRKYWTKARLKPSYANSKQFLMLWMASLCLVPRPFSFVNCNMLLSLGLVLLPVSSSLWQISHDLCIFRILGFPRQSRLHLHRLTQWPLWTSMQGTPDTGLASVAFLSHGGRLHNLFLASLTLKPEPWGWSCHVLLLAETWTQPPCSISSSSFLVLISYTAYIWLKMTL